MKKQLLLLLTAFLTFVLPKNTFAQWESARIITPNAMAAQLNEDAGPCLAVTSDTLHVVWSDHRTNGYAIYYTQSPDTGNTWSTAVPLTDTTGKASMPAIAVWGSTVHVVWMDTLNGVRASYYKRSLNGGVSWGSNIVLDSNTTFWPGVTTSGAMVVFTLNKAVNDTNTEVFIIVSMDNGSTRGPEQRISNAPGRSEDPAIAVKGSYIHLSWNDNRSGTMQIYYRRSPDRGVNWSPETPLTTPDSYTSMVCLDDTNADVPCGVTNGTNLQVNIRQSPDTGATFKPINQLTNTSSIEAYPYMVRNGLNLYLVYLQIGSIEGPWYIHSGDGGATWDDPYSLGLGGQPFIAYTGCSLHAIWPDSGTIHYRRNPTGNCAIATGIASLSLGEGLGVRLYQNPFSTQTTIEISSSENIENAELRVFDVMGKEIENRLLINDRKIIFSRRGLNSGLYFYKLSQKDEIIATGKMLVE